MTTVPSGTGTTRSLPDAPSRRAFLPGPPAFARWWGCSASQDRSWTPLRHLEHDGATVAAVAAVGASPRLVRLGVQRRGPVASTAGFQVSGALIDERHAYSLEPGTGRATGWVVVGAGRPMMGAMPEPTTVWMVRLRQAATMGERKGLLTLDADGLVFGDESLEQVRHAAPSTRSEAREAREGLADPDGEPRRRPWRQGDGLLLRRTAALTTREARSASRSAGRRRRPTRPVRGDAANRPRSAIIART